MFPIWLPTRLYRYRGANSDHFTEELKNLANNRVWLNNINQQNDPFEGELLFRAESSHIFRNEVSKLKTHLTDTLEIEDLLPDQISDAEINEAHLNCPLFAKKSDRTSDPGFVLQIVAKSIDVGTLRRWL